MIREQHGDESIFIGKSKIDRRIERGLNHRVEIIARNGFPDGCGLE